MYHPRENLERYETDDIDREALDAAWELAANGGRPNGPLDQYYRQLSIDAEEGRIGINGRRIGEGLLRHSVELPPAISSRKTTS